MPDEDVASGKAKAPWRTIYFRLEAPEAEQVCVVGDFNDWDPSRHPLQRNADDVWECSMPLAPGRYTYCFAVDGVRRPDPRCDRRERGPDGSAVCVIEVTRPA